MKKGGGLFLFLTVFVLFVFLSYQLTKRDDYEIVFLDVGQGDASLIKTKSGKNILIDAGDGAKIISELSSNLSIFDRQIDLLVLTHPHADHIAGAIDLVKRYEIGTIIYSAAEHNSPDYIELLKLIRDYSIDLKIINHPQRIQIDEESNLEIIYPFTKDNVANAKNLNNTSIVAKFIHGENKFLFTGDIEKEVEDMILARDIDIEADVLKVAHHGSISSSQTSFLERVGASMAVIQLSRDNKFNFPNSEVLARLQKNTKKVLRTDIDGAIKLISTGQSLDLK